MFFDWEFFECVVVCLLLVIVVGGRVDFLSEEELVLWLKSLCGEKD